MARDIGFIGLGAMGKPMALNLIRKGFRLRVYDIVQEKMKPLIAQGARACGSPREMAEDCPIIITIVPAPPDVRCAVLGKEGVIEGIKPGATLIEMSTIDPITSREVAQALAAKGARILDAPVARGVPAAQAGTLSIFVGGDKKVYQECLEILRAMGTDIFHVGAVGCGHVVKMVNNLILAGTIALLSESLVLGVKAGVKPDLLYEALCEGSAASFALKNQIGQSVMKGVFEEGRFPVDYMIKDLGLAMETGKSLHVPLLFGALAMQVYESARAAGKGQKYYPVVITQWEELTGVKVRSEGY
ncbi:MAG: NAD-binding protein [Deltaproteobacteria bacterium]|nr:NAD-binding protein [Deltaproteobacteria bacterium]